MNRVQRLRAVALAVLGGLVVGTLLAGDPPEVEEKNPKGPGKKVPVEEEEGTKKPPKKIEVEDPETPPPSQNPNPTQAEKPPADPGGPYVARLDDVARGAQAATHPAIKKFLLTHAVAYDRLTISGGRMFRITPVPFLWGTDRFPAEFGLAPYDDNNLLGDVRTFRLGQVRNIEPFERVVIEDTTEFLKPPAPGVNPPPASAADRYAAAERLLTAALFFHDTAREQNRRRGKSWDEVKIRLYDQLTAVRVGRVQQAATDKDWLKLQELSKRLVELYKTNPKALEPVYAARLAEAEELSKSAKVTDLERCSELLNDYVSRYPQSNNQTARRIKSTLAALAKKFLAEAETKKANQGEVRNLLQIVQVIDPDNSTLVQKQQELKTGYATLVVGVRRMPEFASPALARFDAELQAVELLFEGLSEALPDEQLGVRYRPSLALDRPGVWAGIRDIQLIPSAEWGGPNRGLVGNADVDATLRLMRERPNSWIGETSAWLDEALFDPNDPSRLRVRLKAGHLDPRSLMTFKVQPGTWLRQQNRAIDDPEFGRRPFGSGPYRLVSDLKPVVPGQPVRDVVFQANPAYARRPGRGSQPFIKEIRFTLIDNYPDVAIELRGERMHILTDVPSTELPRYMASDNLGGKVKIVTAAQNRKIHILALNHRKPELQNVNIRRGLMHAIDRERILKDVFRGTLEGVHKPLSGPFPEGSWATARAGTADPSLSNRDLAQSEFRAYFAAPGAAATLNLLYAADDPQAKLACEKIKAQIESATAIEDRKLILTLEPLPPRELLRRVEQEHRFDLAYLPFEYRDDLYPLALSQFLDSTATDPGGRNYPGFLSPLATTSEVNERLAVLLTAVRQHRDYDGQLLKLTHEMHKRFSEAVPFIPLWQLDRHLVISNAVKVHFEGQVSSVDPKWLHPTRLFSSVALWKVE